MFTPSSAMMTEGAVLHRRYGLEELVLLPEVTFDLLLYLLRQGGEEILHHRDMAQVRLYHEAVVLLHVPHQGFSHLRSSVPQSPFGRLRHRFRLLARLS
jgi:hypothetical protein